jgi:hypothetical protein
MIRNESNDVFSRDLSKRVPMPEYPIDSTELARRLGYGGYPKSNHALDFEIRPLLRRFDCPKAGAGRRSTWRIDEKMARRVADALGRHLH